MSGTSDASPRYELRAPVVYKGTNLQGGGKIANMSTSGALIEPASCAVTPGTPLRILISYSPDEAEPRALELTSQVVRTTESGFAVAFQGARTRIHPSAVSSTPKELYWPQSGNDGNTERQQESTGRIKAKIERELPGYSCEPLGRRRGWSDHVFRIDDENGRSTYLLTVRAEVLTDPDLDPEDLIDEQHTIEPAHDRANEADR
jgi:hypothetical protein